jgi:hypothetical protein
MDSLYFNFIKELQRIPMLLCVFISSSSVLQLIFSLLYKNESRLIKSSVYLSVSLSPTNNFWMAW